MSDTKADFDVAIIGGGPAGAGMASYLAQAGINAVVFERELFPRPHVGESLVPSSTRVFKEIGFIDQMEEHGFPRKYGAVWTATADSPVYDHDWKGLDPDSYADIEFSERKQEGVDRAYTYHVDRGKFDLLLLQHAHHLGAKVYEGIQVRRVDFEEGRPVRLRYSMGRRECTTTAQIVIDASGRRTLIGNQLKWRKRDPTFDQFALHAWFEGFNRRAVAKDVSTAEHIHIHFLPITNSWIWQIPITDSITSVGVVSQKKHFAKRRESRKKFFWDCMRTRPELSEHLRAAHQLRPLREEADYSFGMKWITGDRLLLIGDAARFVDPIFSTGVSIALNCARFASVDVVRALETGSFGRDAFQVYQSTLRRGTRNWYEFITLYYRLNVVFTAFILDDRYRLEVLKLLQGDVYEEDEPAVLRAMRETVTEVERNPSHVWHKLLGDLTANEFRPEF